MTKRFSIVLLIRHPNIDPDAISSELSLDPFSSWKAGDSRVTPKGTKLPGTRDASSWNHVFDYEGEVGIFEETERLLIQLESHKNFFLKIAKEGGYAELYYELPGDVNQGGTAKPSMLKLLVELGLHLGLEVFPDMPSRRAEHNGVSTKR